MVEDLKSLGSVEKPAAFAPHIGLDLKQWREEIPEPTQGGFGRTPAGPARERGGATVVEPQQRPPSRAYPEPVAISHPGRGSGGPKSWPILPAAER